MALSVLSAEDLMCRCPAEIIDSEGTNGQRRWAEQERARLLEARNQNPRDWAADTFKCDGKDYVIPAGISLEQRDNDIKLGDLSRYGAGYDEGPLLTKLSHTFDQILDAKRVRGVPKEGGK